MVNKKKAHMLGLMYGMLASAMEPSYPLMSDYDPIKFPKEKPVPKGAKTYWFNEQGEFSTDHMLKTDCVFKCVAINDKSAIKKFKRWKTQ
jgi:hypothetical protein